MTECKTVLKIAVKSGSCPVRRSLENIVAGGGDWQQLPHSAAILSSFKIPVSCTFPCFFHSLRSTSEPSLQPLHVRGSRKSAGLMLLETIFQVLEKQCLIFYFENAFAY